MKTSTEPEYINRWTIEDFKCIHHETVDARGRSVIIRGGTRTGKTTHLDALIAALGGLPANRLPFPIREGEEKATVRFEFHALGTDWTVERTWNKAGTKFVITDERGTKVPDQKQMLDTLLNRLTVNPRKEFIEIRPQDRVDLLLEVGKIKPPVEEVKKITGEDHPVRDGEKAYAYLARLSADIDGLFFRRRLDQGRIVQQKKLAFAEAQDKLDALGGPLTPQETAASTAELLSEYEFLQEKDKVRREAFQAEMEAAREHGRLADNLAGLQTEKQNVAKRADQLVKQIQALQEELKATNDREQALTARIERGLTIVHEAEDEETKARDAAQALPDVAPQIADVRSRIAQVEKTNERLNERRFATRDRDRLHEEQIREESAHKHLDDCLEGLRTLRRNLPNGIEIGIEGLSIGEGEVLYRGLPFREDQISTSEAYRVAAGVCFLLHPGPLLLDRLEVFDPEGLEEFLSFCRSHKRQVIGTRVEAGPKTITIREDHENGKEASDASV